MSYAPEIPKTWRSALVLGLGASGQAAADLLLAGGRSVCVADERDDDRIRFEADRLRAAGAEVALGARVAPAGAWDVCVVSPGIPITSPLVQSVIERGIALVSELELGWLAAARPTLAVTGSNGKSTLIKLCAEAMAAAGLRPGAGGNYGTPASRLAAEADQYDWLALEASSFQLETVKEFKPEVGVLLNMHPNHLDRHGSMAAYEAAKAAMFARMTGSDTAVVLDSLADRLIELAPGARRWVLFGTSDQADYKWSPGMVSGRGGSGAVRTLSLAGTAFDNTVLGMTAAAAWAALSACGIPDGALSAAMAGFEPLPHRMQTVAVAQGVRFVDDSKATNMAALAAAVRMTHGPVRLIAGGMGKAEPFDNVVAELAGRVAAAYLIGRDADAIAAAWARTVPCRVCGTLEAAVREAWEQAVFGDTILLSPGCASFDQFRSFEERGTQFAELVRALLSSRPEPGRAGCCCPDKAGGPD